MRVKSDGTPLGGFYVPWGYHLRIHLGTEDLDRGWFSTSDSCPDTACNGVGYSLWFTRGDAYNYPNKDPLL